MNPRTKKILFKFGFAFSPVYSQVMSFRSYLFKKRILTVHDLPVPVISVGNLTMGGTGKTPLVLYLAKHCLAQGLKPAVISRGYRGKKRNPVNIVSDGSAVLMTPEECGDEPWLLASEVPGLVVATGKKRIIPATQVIDSFGCNVIILDDGFQHMGVARTVDLVLFDVTTFAGNSRVFPGGELREPVRELARADAFVLTGNNQKNTSRADKIKSLLKQRFPTKEIFLFSGSYSAARKYHYDAQTRRVQTISLDLLPPNLICFCGIANPERFREMLTLVGVSWLEFFTFPDHHPYTTSNLLKMIDRAEKRNAAGFLTTEKDVHKVAALYNHRLPIFTLPLEYETNEAFNTYFDSALN